MNMKLYVGNLPFSATEVELRDLFAQHGTVTDCHLVLDLVTRNSRGFAFVTMETKESADLAIAGLNGQDWQGRSLSVNEARPREERPASGGAPSGAGGFRRSGGRDDRGDRGGRGSKRY